MKEVKAKKRVKDAAKEQNTGSPEGRSKNTEDKEAQEKASNTDLGVAVEENLKPKNPLPPKDRDLSKMQAGGLTTRNRPKTEKKVISKSTAKAYLQHGWETVSKVNKKGEYEIVNTADLKQGETVFILTEGDVFVETKVV